VATVPALGRADVSPAVAVSRLYESYYDRVYGYCLRCLGSREEAEDAAQSTFLYALRGLERGVVPNVEANWVFAIARNVCLARHRTRGRRRDRECLSDPVALADLHAAPEPAGEELAGIEDALACLPEQQRRAILLREWRGLSYREIAAELGLSNSAVETLIFRARRALAAQLGGKAAPARSRAVRGLDLGSLGAGFKSLLAGGGAVKVAAAAAAALVTAGVVAGDALTPQQTAPRAGRQVLVDPAEHTQLAARAAAQTTGPQAAEDRPSRAAPAGDQQAGVQTSPDGKPATQETAPGSVIAPVEDGVETAGIEVDLPSLPDVPELPVPDVPLPEVQLPETPEVDLPVGDGLPLP
jgi:RNA polymerase sigma factor (sigma-70 family)